MKRYQMSVITIVGLLISSLVFADSPIAGSWKRVNKDEQIDFIDGFAPNRGALIMYKGGAPSSIKQWKIEDNKISGIGCCDVTFTVFEDKLQLGDKLYTIVKQKEQLGTSIIDLKKDPDRFSKLLVDNYWSTPTKDDVFLFKKAFSTDSGFYSVTEKEGVTSLGSWSLANGVLKKSDTIYVNARISNDLMLLLNKNDSIVLYRQSGKVPPLQTIELKESGEEFIKKLTSGRWKTPSLYSKPTFTKYRPVFGDLSGVEFKDSGENFSSSNEWEYSLDTGALKIGYTTYVNAQIQGDYLILLKKDGSTYKMVRPKDEEVKLFTVADVRHVEVTESNPIHIKNLLKGQWFKSPFTYKFIFKPNGTEGWVHKFQTIPFIVTGNTMKINGVASNFHDIRFIDKEVVLGKNSFSARIDSKPVMLRHQDESESRAEAEQQHHRTQEMQTKNLFLVVKTKDGGEYQIQLPVDDMGDIDSLSIDNF